MADDGAKVTIEREECISCGQCWETCPDYFEQADDDGFSQILEAYRINGNLGKGTVPEDLIDCVTEAADGCPVEIITVE